MSETTSDGFSKNVKKKNRKPLVIKGARQFGETWLMNLPLYAISLLDEIEFL